MKTIFKNNNRFHVLLIVCSLALLFPFSLYASCQVNNGIYNDHNGTYITYNSNISAQNYLYYSYNGIVDLSGIRTANRIYHYSFYKCYVTNVRIPSNITSIEQYAFYGCSELKRILLESPTCDFGSNIFSWSNSTILYVPEGYRDYYRNKGLGVTIIDGFSASGQSFSGSGSGTQDDPYLIFNPIQLNQVRNFLDEKYVHFKLMADIDLTEWLADNNPSQGWQPIGTQSSPFMGIFDGNGHKITGLYINRPSTDNIGLFGYLLWAEISNLNIENCEINGNNKVAALAAESISSDITFCYVNGSIRAEGNCAGGFIGCGSGNISNCISHTAITGNNCIGGLVGSSFNGQGAEFNIVDCTFYGSASGKNYVAGGIGYSDHYITISNYRSMGYVSSDGNNIGGIVGFSCGGLLDISNSYSLCDITCNGKNAGGIIGYYKYEKTDLNATSTTSMQNKIESSYYNGSINADSAYVGGIIGYSNYNSGEYTKGVDINGCYAYANIIGDSYVGGIAGYVRGSKIKSNVSICSLISAVSSNVGRIYGSDDMSGVTIGETGTSNENKGLATASVLLNGVAQDMPDGLKHGTNVGNATLKLKATYQGMGWDFDDWTIVETESYPYKSVQCAPPIISSILEAKATEVSGNSIDGGTVTLVTGGNEYTTQTTGNEWAMQVVPLQAGDLVKACADTEDKLPSYYNLYTVRFGGNGTEADPYSIYTAEDLQSINSYAYYKLQADIDLTEWINENNPSGGWIPIGASGNATMKQLDGNGHKITGLWCNNDMENCGLFATMNNATILDLSVFTAIGRKVKGGRNTGALVGYAEGTQFESITVHGDVEGNENVGGIVGYCETSPGLSNYNHLSRCSLYGTVTGDYNVGGIVGQLSGRISESYSQGTITGNGTTCYVGGIVGYNRFLVENCYSDANIVAGFIDNSIPSSSLNQYAGGIVGDNGHTVHHCYATGNLFAVKCAAGIAGYNTSSAANVNQCYAMNRKIEVADASGIAMRVIGGIRNGAPTPEANNYALNSMIVSVNNIPQTIYDDLLHGQSLTDAVLKEVSTYSNNGWDMDNIWNINEGESFPYLRSIDVQEEEPVDVLLGDANGDGNVTITDVVLAAQVAVGKTPSVFIEENADVNGDGRINITDVVIIANIAVGKPIMAKSAPSTICTAGNHLTMTGFNLNAGEAQNIEIVLDNTTQFTGFQMDIALPDGIELLDARLTERTKEHSLIIGDIEDIKRLLMFSAGNEVIDDTSGPILVLTVKATQGITKDMVISLNNILFVEPNGTTNQFDNLVLHNDALTDIVEAGNNTINIYGENCKIIIESSKNGEVQIVTPNGVCRTYNVKAGYYEVPVPSGIYIVRFEDKIAKIVI